jgi:hypothetical protein
MAKRQRRAGDAKQAWPMHATVRPAANSGLLSGLDISAKSYLARQPHRMPDLGEKAMTTCQLCNRETDNSAFCSTCEPRASRVADVDSQAVVRKTNQVDMQGNMLKPCPFCGSPDGMHIDNDGRPSCFPVRQWWVFCECGVETGRYNTEDEAINAWQSRADVDGQAATCHKCGETVGKNGYADDLRESSLCAKHLAEFAAKLDHCADVFFGEQPKAD